MKKSRRSPDRLLLAAVAVAMGVILWGALFLIAPVWQFPTGAAVSYQAPAAGEETAPELIDVNTADAEALTALPGIGPAKAAAIIAYREEHGPFSSLAELDEVQGISSRMVESWEGLATAGGGAASVTDTN